MNTPADKIKEHLDKWREIDEAARKQAYMGSFIDGPGKELQDAMDELDKLEGDGSGYSPIR